MRAGAPGTPSVDPVQHSFNVLREALSKRGVRGIFSMARSFRIMDDDRSFSLDWEEFNKGMNDFRVPLGPDQRMALFRAFDVNNNNTICYDEFLRGVVGEMSAFRVGLVKQAFRILDRDGSGVVNVDDLRGVYNGKFHPDVVAGKKSEDEVLQEWLDTFEDHYNIRHQSQSDGTVTLDEFIEYYSWVSMSIYLDSYFELMMKSAWNLDGTRVTQKGWGAAY